MFAAPRLGRSLGGFSRTVSVWVGSVALLTAAQGDFAAQPTGGHKLDMYYADPSAPNISGFWRGEPGGPRLWTWIVDGKPLVHDTGGAFIGLPYTPAWQAVYQARVKSNLAGRPYGEPHFDCWPRGAIHDYIGGDSTMTLTQTPGLVTQVFEEQSQVRRIYTDGRKHPASVDPKSDSYLPSSLGHSIGHWEGDTLVVDTLGVRKEFTLGFLAPHSDVLHIVERIRRSDPTHLDIQLTVDDAKAFTEPLTMQLRYVQVKPPDDQFIEDFCSENLRNSTDANGFVQTDISPRKGFGWDLPDE